MILRRYLCFLACTSSIAVYASEEIHTGAPLPNASSSSSTSSTTTSSSSTTSGPSSSSSSSSSSGGKVARPSKNAVQANSSYLSAEEVASSLETLRLSPDGVTTENHYDAIMAGLVWLAKQDLSGSSSADGGIQLSPEQKRRFLRGTDDVPKDIKHNCPNCRESMMTYQPFEKPPPRVDVWQQMTQTMRMRVRSILMLAMSSTVVGGSEETSTQSPSPSYGVDVSWPVHHKSLTEHAQFQNTKQVLTRYINFIDGCKRRYEGPVCDIHEHDRINMNLKQPAAMQNYTHAGYAKVPTPRNAKSLLRAFFDANVGKEKEELWSKGNTYTNHWEAPTKMLRLGDPHLEWSGEWARRRIIEDVQTVLEAWSGQSLMPTSVYGIRIYTEGSILTPHVDRLPLVVSAIVNVAQDVEEPWPLEIIDHEGNARNVTLEPGEMILYESHSVIHGRPFPLKGNYYANCFLHFEPQGHSVRHVPNGLDGTEEDTKKLYESALQKKKQKVNKKTIPDYIQKGSEEEERWNQQFVFERAEAPAGTEKDIDEKPEVAINSLAAAGRVETIRELVEQNPDLWDKPDENGWKPLHEAARAGNAKVLEFLIEKGADVNERTNNGKGGTPLWWAMQSFSEEHDVVKVLRRHGAESHAPANKKK